MERYTIVLICFLCLWSALTTNDLERSGLFCLGGYSSLSSEVGSGTQGRDLETRTKAEVIEKFCLPTHAWPIQRPFLYSLNPLD